MVKPCQLTFVYYYELYNLMKLHNKLIYRGRIIRLEKNRVRLPNGRIVDLDIVRHPGASAIVPIMDDGSYILIKQYRHATGGYIYEIPAGTINKGESPLQCAKRELIEETGFSAKRFKRLISLRTTPGFTNELIHIYLATGLSRAEIRHDFDEVINVKIVSKRKLIKMINSNEIVDAKSLVGLYKTLFK